MPDSTTSKKRPMKLFDRPILSYFVIAIFTLFVFSIFNAIQTVLGLEGAVADLFNIAYLIPQVIFSGTELALAIWLLRTVNFDQIRAIWDEKWSL